VFAQTDHNTRGTSTRIQLRVEDGSSHTTTTEVVGPAVVDSCAGVVVVVVVAAAARTRRSHEINNSHKNATHLRSACRSNPSSIDMVAELLRRAIDGQRSGVGPSGMDHFSKPVAPSSVLMLLMLLVSLLDGGEERSDKAEPLRVGGTSCCSCDLFTTDIRSTMSAWVTANFAIISLKRTSVNLMKRSNAIRRSPVCSTNIGIVSSKRTSRIIVGGAVRDARPRHAGDINALRWYGVLLLPAATHDGGRWPPTESVVERRPPHVAAASAAKSPIRAPVFSGIRFPAAAAAVVVVGAAEKCVGLLVMLVLKWFCVILTLNGLPLGSSWGVMTDCDHPRAIVDGCAELLRSWGDSAPSDDERSPVDMDTRCGPVWWPPGEQIWDDELRWGVPLSNGIEPFNCCWESLGVVVWLLPSSPRTTALDPNELAFDDLSKNEERGMLVTTGPGSARAVFSEGEKGMETAVGVESGFT
jgi:hypothetical protein